MYVARIMTHDVSLFEKKCHKGLTLRFNMHSFESITLIYVFQRLMLIQPHLGGKLRHFVNLALKEQRGAPRKFSCQA